MNDRTKSNIQKTLITSIVNKAITYLSIMVIAKIMLKREYGIWTYVLNVYSYLSLVSAFGLAYGNVQFGTENKGGGKAFSIYKYCFWAGSAIDVFIVGVCIVIYILLEPPIADSRPSLIAFIPILLFEYAFLICQGVLRSQNRINEYCIVTNISSLTNAVGTCFGALAGIWGIIFGRYVSRVITLIFCSIFLRNDYRQIESAPQLTGKEKSILWKFSVMAGVSAAMNLLIYSIDVTMISHLIESAELVAVYKIGSIIPNALLFIPRSIMVAVLPSIINNRESISWIKACIKKISLWMLLLNVIMAIGLLVFAPQIIGIFAGNQYQESVAIFRILAIAFFVAGAFRALSLEILIAFRRTKYSVIAGGASCVMAILLDWLMINMYGIIGAAYATFFVDVIFALVGFGYIFFLLRTGTINECLYADGLLSTEGQNR